jgi:hypothetical protein
VGEILLASRIYEEDSTPLTLCLRYASEEAKEGPPLTPLKILSLWSYRERPLTVWKK